jgi:hypothetical protein
MKGQKISFFNPYAPYVLNGKQTSIYSQISRTIAKDKQIMAATNNQELINMRLKQIFEAKWALMPLKVKRQILKGDPATHCPQEEVKPPSVIMRPWPHAHLTAIV